MNFLFFIFRKMTAKCAICLAFLAASTLFLVVTTDKSVSDILVYLPFKRKTLENSYNYYAHTSQTSENSHPHIPPRLAYVISGSKGDGMRMKRLLQALYHPRNQYVLHLDFESSIRERVDVSRYVRLDPMFVKMRNVHFISKANLITYKGPTMIACTLHAAAILLKNSKDWDWFINLSASDYPLVTQDGMCSLFPNHECTHMPFAHACIYTCPCTSACLHACMPMCVSIMCACMHYAYTHCNHECMFLEVHIWHGTYSSCQSFPMCTYVGSQ